MKVNNLREKLRPYLLLAPVLTVLTGIFLSGIITAVLQSLGYFSAIGLNEFTLKYYKEVLTDKGFLSSFKFSLYTSFISSATATVLGVLLAYSILQLKSGGRKLELLFRLPIIVPHMTAVLLIYNMLARTGILPRALYKTGILAESGQFPAILYGENGLGIILAYIWKELPFIAVTTYAILSKLSSRLFEAAYNLGANRRQVFFHVLLPLVMPSVVSSFIIIFAFSFGAYEVPLLLGPTDPKTLPVKAYLEYSSPVLENRPYAMAINMIITMTALVLTWFYINVFKRIYPMDR